LSREIEIPQGLVGDKLTIRAKVSWLVCKDVCIPGDAEVKLDIPLQTGPAPALSSASASTPASASIHHSLFERNWAREPKLNLPATVYASKDTLSLVLPISVKEAQKVEFFAESEETIVHSAPQPLYRLKDGRFRLDVSLAQEKKPDFAKQSEKAKGVLDVDGQFYVIAPKVVEPAPSMVSEGALLVATLAGAPSRDAQGQPSPAEALLKATREASDVTSQANMGANPQVMAGSSKGDVLGTGELGTSPGLLLSLAAALVGGLILNLMPCVFPVIGLKLMSFAGHGTLGATMPPAKLRRMRIETLAFALGVIVSFLILGGLMLMLRSAGQSVGWGFQLQSPLFVGAMVLLFVGLGLNFAGLFEVGLSLTQLGQIGEHAGASGAPGADDSSASHPMRALLTGVLAVLVATPCTAPFMGSALGFSLAQPAAEALLVFAFLGLGMALPYLILAAFPAWLRYLPRPGPWMESFKQFLAFPMFAAAIWLLWVFGLQTSPESLMRLALGSVALGFSLWVYGRFFQRSPRLVLFSGTGIFAALLVIGGIFSAAGSLLQGHVSQGAEFKPLAATAWAPWSSQAVQDGLAQGRPVFVDFTAAWCVSCQANKKLVLETDAVQKGFAQSKALTLKADWTKQDPLITAELTRYGRSGVPLYLVYLPGQKQAKLLSELLTQNEVLSALGLLAR
jgi:thiol:disulfide interchange protein